MDTDHNTHGDVNDHDYCREQDHELKGPSSLLVAPQNSELFERVTDSAVNICCSGLLHYICCSSYLQY